MATTVCTLEEFNARIDAIGPGVPDAVEYQSLCELTVRHPSAEKLRRLDPFSQAYREAVLALYFDLRGRDDGYQPARDETSAVTRPPNPFVGITPWAFQDTVFVAEFLESWAQILRAMALPANSGASVLEYGPGNGQMLLMLARMGFSAYGVDIDQTALDTICRQAEAMGVQLQTERAEFGEGFAGERFDRIVFFEAFHHAFEFEKLLSRLHERLKPGGRLILCGEPVMHSFSPGVPYPWGPRLDAMSVLCMRRYGWMELGFNHNFLMKAFARAGWYVEFDRPVRSARALTYIAQRQCDRPAGGTPPGALLVPPPSLPRRVFNRLGRMLRR
jgi:2-polyprenyl-3-methyl-5-hydroxy-6-metoxy-1,4-benzoquinol methylase